MGSCFSISVALALEYNRITCSSCRRVLRKNRDKYILLQDKKVCNKCIDIKEVDVSVS